MAALIGKKGKQKIAFRGSDKHNVAMYNHSILFTCKEKT
jgi:hypothetical protein